MKIRKRFITAFLILCAVINASAQLKNETNNEYNNIELYSFTSVATEETIPILWGVYGSWENDISFPKIRNIPSPYLIELSDYSMPNKHNYITSKFGRRWGRNHNGVDIKSLVGDSVHSAFDGVVRLAKHGHRGYGNYIIIRHYNGLETLYAHLSKIMVTPNQKVKTGEIIALSGNTGRSTGPHLHFETRFCGIPINPMSFFSFSERKIITETYMFKT